MEINNYPKLWTKRCSSFCFTILIVVSKWALLKCLANWPHCHKYTSLKAFSSWSLESRVFSFSPLLFSGVLPLQGNAPILLPKPIRVLREQLFHDLTGDSSLPAVFLKTWTHPEALQAFAFFLSAPTQVSLWSSLSQDIEDSRFPLPSLG